MWVGVVENGWVGIKGRCVDRCGLVWIGCGMRVGE